ncbi:multidrug resistance protein [Trypanosoma theileri]|uniref:Multidrug resistance protein n=1 Tax=Trypanosoma theileri TaxID=67003 RepID=A0A1X0NVN7_9TRYP|nr:multidrug resistance protein [Trypanosoma theileri]ORC88774.1 multidrug resistance protein [Trypanosoma theileri]
MPSSNNSSLNAASRDEEEEREPFFRSISERENAPVHVRFSIRETLRRLLYSYKLRSKLSIALFIAYHLFHIGVIIIILFSPLTIRSLLFQTVDDLEMPLTKYDPSGTRVASIWEVDSTHFTWGSSNHNNPLLHLDYKNKKIMNEHSGESFFTWEASPFSLLMYYYLYILASLFILVMITGGRITGHFALLQLICGGMELVWFILHEPPSFAVFFWLSHISSLLPYPYVPFIKIHTNGEVTYHVFNWTAVSSNTSLSTSQLQLREEIYMIPYNNTLETIVFYTTTIFLFILVCCLTVSFQRVLDALLGIQQLGVPDGYRRCPLCGEEWEIALESAGKSKKRNNTIGNDNTNNTNNNNNNNEDDNDEEEEEEEEYELNATTTMGLPNMTIAFPASHRHFSQHRCRKLFHDKNGSDGFLDSTGWGSSSMLDPLALDHDSSDDHGDNNNNNDDDDDDDDNNNMGNKKNNSKRVKALRFKINRSLAFPLSYGTMNTTTQPVGERVLYDPFTDKQDEFRPGNVFPSLEDAGWMDRVTYSWLNPLMSFSVINRDVLRHERFLPSLPEDFTSLQNIATPAWQLWVNRGQWYGKKKKENNNNNTNTNNNSINNNNNNNGNGSVDSIEFGTHNSNNNNNNNSNNNNNNDDDDDSSDDKTFAATNQPRVLTSAKLRPKRPKRSFLENTVRFFATPVYWLLGKTFMCFFVGCGEDEIQVNKDEEIEKLRKKQDKSDNNNNNDDNDNDNDNAMSSTVTSDETSISEKMEKKVKFNRKSTDVGLFTVFLDHRCGRRFVYSCVPLRILSDLLSLSMPIIIYYLVTIMEGKDTVDVGNALHICGVLFLVLLTRAVLQQEYMSQLYLSSLEAGTAIKSLILEKTLALPLAQRTFTEAEVIHLVTVDAPRCSQTLLQLHQYWRCPCFAIASLYVLHIYVGTISTLAALLVMLLSIPLQRIAGRYVHTAQEQRTSRTVDRVELVGEAVTSMRQVKAMGVENVYLHRIHMARQQETEGEITVVQALARAACMTEVFGILLSSVCYAVYHFTGGPLTVRVVIPALVALNLLRSAVSEWSAVMTTVPGGYTSFRRIESYLQQTPDEFIGTWVDLTAEWSQNRGTVICQGSSFTWQADHTQEVPRPILRDVHMHIRPGELVVLQGPLGAGKSTLLLAILGEVNRCGVGLSTTTAAASAINITTTEVPVMINTTGPVDETASVHSDAGSANVSITSSTNTRIRCVRFDGTQSSSDGFYVFGRAVYCPETPWLQNDTIRANIVADDTYNPRWYQTVIKACALQEDFDALEKGDDSVVSDKGVQLSTGQRVRVALARALYARADVYVLDNVLSSLDAPLQSHIIKRVFHGLLRNRTVILATLVGLSELKPDRLFTVYKDGIVVEVESPKTENPNQKSKPNKKIANLYAAEREEPEVIHSSDDDDSDSDTDSDSDGDYNNDFGTNNDRKKVHALGFNRLTHSRTQLHRFISLMGPSLIWLMLSNITQHVLQVGRDVWLSLWISTRPTSPTVFLLLYFLVGAAAALCTIPRIRMFFYAVRKSINHIHFVAIERMFRAPVSYFDVNTGSSITTIFSRDQETADHSVGESLDAITTGLLQMMAIAFFNAVVNPWFILIIPLTVFLFYHVIERYLAVARQLRRLENKSVRGPVTILWEVLEGTPVIRCVGLRDTIREEYCKAMDVANTASIISHMTNCWVSLRLEFITVMMTTTAALLGALFASYIMTPAFAGVAVVCCLQTSQTLSRLCRSIGDFQLQFVSVEQLFALQKAPEEPLVIPITTTSTTTMIIKEEEENKNNDNNDNKEKDGIHKVEIHVSMETSDTVQQQQPKEEEQQHKHPSVHIEEDKKIVKKKKKREEKENVKQETENISSSPLLELVNISAKYRESLPYAMHHVNLRIYPKERIGIIGRSGDGKSTLFNILLRLVDVLEGDEIQLCGNDTRSIPYPALRRRFMLVLQDPLIVRGTWRSNLLLGSTTTTTTTNTISTINTISTASPFIIPTGEEREVEDINRHDFSDAALWAALRRVNLDTLAAQHGGLDAPLHQPPSSAQYQQQQQHYHYHYHYHCGNVRLSAGQRQLLWLARAVLHQPEILLLDELQLAAAAAEVESVVQRVLTEDLRDCTVLLIAHQVQTIEALCTRVAVVDKGSVSQVLEVRPQAAQWTAMKKRLERLVE